MKFAKLAVKAFTLSETLVAMLISALLLMIVYQTLMSVEHRYQLFFAQVSAQSQISLLENTLTRDIDQAYSVQKVSSNRLLIYLRPSAAKVTGLQNDNTGTDAGIAYEFSENRIVRHQSSRLDTFSLQVDSLTFGWQGKPVVHSEGIVDQLHFTGRLRGESYYYHFTKAYDSQYLWQKQLGEKP